MNKRPKNIRGWTKMLTEQSPKLHWNHAWIRLLKQQILTTFSFLWIQQPLCLWVYEHDKSYMVSLTTLLIIVVIFFVKLGMSWCINNAALCLIYLSYIVLHIVTRSLLLLLKKFVWFGLDRLYYVVVQRKNHTINDKAFSRLDGNIKARRWRIIISYLSMVSETS